MRGKVFEKRWLLLSAILFGAILLIPFLFSMHIVGTSDGIGNYTTNEDTTTSYNITINNTETNFASNITKVNITIPSSFVFTFGTNGSNSVASLFNNTTRFLIWEADGLVINSSVRNFWFNATTATPGNYNLTVSTTNQTGTYFSNLSVKVTDLTSPYNISFVSPTYDDEEIVSTDDIKYNISAKDNGEIDRVRVFLYNSSYILINSAILTTPPYYGVFSNLDEGEYYINASVNDSGGNTNHSETRVIGLYTTPPGVGLVYPTSSAVITSSPYNFTFDVDSLIKVVNCTLILNSNAVNTSEDISGRNKISKSLSNGSYNWSVNCTDIAGNRGSSSKKNFTVSLSSGVSTTSTESTTNTTNTTLTNTSYETFQVDNTSLEQGFKEVVSKGDKVYFNLSNESHRLEVQNITNSSIKIIVYSTPQQATIILGAEKRFELSGDKYDDLSVKLNLITGNAQANITIKKIHELIVNTANQNTSVSSTPKTKDKSKNGMIVLIVIAVIIMGISLFGVLAVLKKMKHKEESKINNPVLSEGSESNSNRQINQPGN